VSTVEGADMTGSSEVRVGAGALTGASRLVAGARQDFDRMGRDLGSQVAGLRGRWAGSGGQAFFGLHQAWDDRQRRVVAALDDFEASLRGTDRDLAATDDAQATTFTGFQHRLG
jgi:WXG100 family type VII secretion target